MEPQPSGTEAAARRPRWPAVVLGLAGTIFAATALLPFSTIRGYIDSFAFDGSAEPYTQELHSRLQIASAAIGIILLTAAGVLLMRKRSSQGLGVVLHRLRQDAATAMQRGTVFARREWPWMLAIAVAAAAIRFPWIDQPIRFDEATSWLDYANQPLVVTVSKYDMPNNHVFHSVCMGLAVRCCGSSLWSLRLTALVAGMLTCVLAGCLTFALTGPSDADVSTRRFVSLLCGLCVATSSVMIEYSTLARGYTLTTCFTLLCWLTAREAMLSRNLFLASVSVMSAALGLWTIPVMVYPLVTVSFILLWDPEIRGWPLVGKVAAGTSVDGLAIMPRRELRRWLVGGWMAVIGITCILYVPVMLVSGPASLSGNSFVAPMGLGEWFAAWTTAANEGQTFTWRDLPIVVRCFWIFGIVSLVTRRDRWLARLTLLGALVVPVIFLPMVQRVHPPARVWLYLVPTLAVFSTWGWCTRLQVLRSTRWKWAAQPAVLGVMVVWPAWHVLRTDPLAVSWESGQVREAEAACRFLQSELQPAEPIVAVCPASAPLKYYAYRMKIDWKHFDWPMTENTRDDLAIVAVSNEGGCKQTLDDVLDALQLGDEFEGWSREEVWSKGGLTLYRLRRP